MKRKLDEEIVNINGFLVHIVSVSSGYYYEFNVAFIFSQIASLAKFQSSLLAILPSPLLQQRPGSMCV